MINQSILKLENGRIIRIYPKDNKMQLSIKHKQLFYDWTVFSADDLQKFIEILNQKLPMIQSEVKE